MTVNKKHIIAMAILVLFGAGNVYADKPDHAGQNGKNSGKREQPSAQRSSEKNNDRGPQAKGHENRKQDTKRDSRSFTTEQRGNSSKHDRNYRDGRNDTNISVNIGFNDRQRTYIRDYYHDEFSRGHCPPGLAKKHNGCMPPGQAKKWRKGYPLDRDVIFYDLPPSILIELGAPPRGYRYVRVAADILMIAVGTGLVVDAVADLSDLL
ncbi:MAG TPA: RcnB family protein [Eoetvoesiella sp.]